MRTSLSARILVAVLLFSILSVVSPGRTTAAVPLRIGSDISYAPLEFYRGPSKVVTGFDYDLAQALGKVLGRPVIFENRDFNGLIKDVQAGTIDAAMSAISDTRAREKQVDFLDYFIAGSGILVPKGNPRRIFFLAGLCGLTVDLQKGTSQFDAATAASKTCTSLGLGPITILASATDDAALKFFLAGKSYAHITDYPVAAYLAQTLGGGTKYELAGHQFAAVPYGIAVRKGNAELLTQLQAALKTLVANGTYDAILIKWHLKQGALRSAPINAGTLFEH